MSESPKAISYGRALYYPYINIRNEKWLKTAALFYKGIDRIVPESFAPKDSDTIRALIDSDGFVRNVDPRRAARNVAYYFKDFAKRKLLDKSSNNDFFPFSRKLKELTKPNEKFLIHVDKASSDLVFYLEMYGLAKPSNLLPIFIVFLHPLPTMEFIFEGVDFNQYIL